MYDAGDYHYYILKTLINKLKWFPFLSIVLKNVFWYGMIDTNYQTVCTLYVPGTSYYPAPTYCHVIL